MIAPLPPIPDSLDGGQAKCTVQQRFEDICQDGRIVLPGIPHALGASAWAGWAKTEDSPRCHQMAMVPILARLLLEGGSEPVSCFDPLEVVGTWHRAAVRSPEGETQRILLNMWCELQGLRGNTYFPTPPDAPKVVVGRLFAEHVYTRLFAPPSERRVLDIPGANPKDSWSWRVYSEVASSSGEVLGTTRLTFGLAHTDSNQHVNSLVYPRLFEGVVLEHVPTWKLARRCEIMFRKPFFAGESCEVRIWPTDGGIGGAFVDSAGTERCRVELSEG